MKKYFYALPVLFSVILFTSCSSSKTYFTPAIRSRVEANSVALTKIQYYVDRDIVLKRELDKGETKVVSGAVKFQNGHYVNIITLKKGTPGICTVVAPNKLSISFETGDNRYLTFGKTLNGTTTDPYRVLANQWINDEGVITYEGKPYHIESSGVEAGVKIKTKWLNVDKVETRQMKGRTVSSNSAQ